MEYHCFSHKDLRHNAQRIQEGRAPRHSYFQTSGGTSLSRGPQLPWHCTMQQQPIAPRALQPCQHSPPLKSIKLQAFITSGWPHTAVSCEHSTFHTHPLHRSALQILWEQAGSVRQPYLCKDRDSCDLQMVWKGFTMGCILHIASQSLLASLNQDRYSV